MTLVTVCGSGEVFLGSGGGGGLAVVGKGRGEVSLGLEVNEGNGGNCGKGSFTFRVTFLTGCGSVDGFLGDVDGGRLVLDSGGSGDGVFGSIVVDEEDGGGLVSLCPVLLVDLARDGGGEGLCVDAGDEGGLGEADGGSGSAFLVPRVTFTTGLGSGGDLLLLRESGGF